MGDSDRVGVRELRQNLSVYLTRVLAGETLEVTDRGHAVAILAPLAAGERPLSRLQREGRLLPATTDLLSRRTRPRAARGRVARTLDRERADRKL